MNGKNNTRKMQTSPKRYQGQVKRQSRAYQVVLDGQVIKDSQDLYRAFAQGMDKSVTFAGNLDALYDVLTANAKPLKLILKHPVDLRSNLASKAEPFFTMIKAARAANPQLEIID
ncbi:MULTISPECIES: barstar family protein [Aerococcus]|uniref:barstar family protein n=1 Tax=Aerococcus urinae (strain CCUG 59500 / ACS-120-V-Col10a) TaxID=2976812 RepID=UPI000200F3A0|nr:barstar family protein [Aerococcus sp. Group 1]AEA01790.1 hypothetical protein HMPREF9243_0481 [Aerococcus sp. Group 1]MCY3031236.1 barstar family protein [Aerococcus sp. Group 1]MCY3054896.1 barstar family protein [Aerococcus sp. Group 1]MCY3056626.1 barstar family protein [Aerococcus sp. Group 1]MCY3062123.1 barstar family protein [Aerococcus sp. Group 1]